MLSDTVKGWADELRNKMSGESTNFSLSAEEEAKAIETVLREEESKLHVHCNNCGHEGMPERKTENYSGENVIPGGYTEMFDVCSRCKSECIVDLEEYNEIPR